MPEALAGQASAGFWGISEPFDEGSGPFCLRHEGGDRPGYRLGRDPVPGQVVPDPGVPVASVGECFRPRAREPLVIEVPDALEGLERVVPFVLVDPGPSEALFEIAARAVAMLQRARRDLDRILPPRRAPGSPR